MVANKHGSHGRRVHTVQTIKTINWSGSKICCNNSWVATISDEHLQPAAHRHPLYDVLNMEIQRLPRAARKGPSSIHDKHESRSPVDYPKDNYWVSLGHTCGVVTRIWWIRPGQFWSWIQKHPNIMGFLDMSHLLCLRVWWCRGSHFILFCFQAEKFANESKTSILGPVEGVQLDAVDTTCPTGQLNRYCRNSYRYSGKGITWTLFIFSSNTSLPLWFPVFSLRWWMLNDTLHHEPIHLKTSKASLGSVWTSWHRAFG